MCRRLRRLADAFPFWKAQADDLDNLIADSLTGVQTALDDRKAK